MSFLEFTFLPLSLGLCIWFGVFSGSPFLLKEEKLTSHARRMKAYFLVQLHPRFLQRVQFYPQGILRLSLGSEITV